MKSLLHYASWTIVAVVAAGLVFAFSERQFLERYLTHQGDPLVLPVTWFDPQDAVAGDRDDDIPVISDGAGSIPVEALEAATAYAEAQKTQALIIVHDGTLQLERYWDGTDRSTLFNPQSMAKSVLAMLVGIAIAEGHIESVDDPVGKYIEEWSDDPRGAATVRQTLWMAAGLEQMATSYDISLFTRGTWYNFGDDFDGMILDLKQVDPPGTKFDYNNEENNLLGIVIERATGQRYADYLSEKLWRPLGLNDAGMYLDREGGSVMKSCCIFSRAYDWAKLGLLVLNGGSYNGMQIVPKEWIAEMITPSPLVPFYGYQTWLGDGYIQRDTSGSSDIEADLQANDYTYAADDIILFLGYGGQKVWISPSNNLVIVRSTVQWADGWVETRIPNIILNALAEQQSAASDEP